MLFSENFIEAFFVFTDTEGAIFDTQFAFYFFHHIRSWNCWKSSRKNAARHYRQILIELIVWFFFCLLRRDDLFEDWSGTWRTSTESSSSSVLQRNITQKYLMEWFYFIELIFFFDLFLLNIHLRPTIIKLRIFIGAFGIILILIARKIFQVILFYYWAARQSRSAR